MTSPEPIATPAADPNPPPTSQTLASIVSQPTPAQPIPSQSTTSLTSAESQPSAPVNESVPSTPKESAPSVSTPDTTHNTASVTATPASSESTPAASVAAAKPTNDPATSAPADPTPAAQNDSTKSETAKTDLPKDESAAPQIDPLIAMREASANMVSETVHGLRQPMTVLRGYSDMLSTPGMLGPMNEMQQQFAETIRANVISMDALLTDVSDYNKLISERLRLEPKMTTFSQILMDVQKQLEPLIEKLGRSPTWDTPSGLPILVVDSKQVAKIMIKLISNALLYTPEGGTVTVKAERLPDNILHISVIDTGIGMTPEEVAKLGHLFFRGANEQVTSQKGYGMSMAVVTRLIPVMDSKLEIETVPGKGSTFGFTLKGVG